jgi:hypothetical protein
LDNQDVKPVDKPVDKPAERPAETPLPDFESFRNVVTGVFPAHQDTEV